MVVALEVAEILEAYCCRRDRYALPNPGETGSPAMSRHERPSHRVYLSFFFCQGWYCQFFETDLKTPLPKKPTIASANKVRELAALGEQSVTLRVADVEDAIINRRGGVYLNLTQAQYERLKRPSFRTLIR